MTTPTTSPPSSQQERYCNFVSIQKADAVSQHASLSPNLNIPLHNCHCFCAGVRVRTHVGECVGTTDRVSLSFCAHTPNCRCLCLCHCGCQRSSKLPGFEREESGAPYRSRRQLPPTRRSPSRASQQLTMCQRLLSTPCSWTQACRPRERQESVALHSLWQEDVVGHVAPLVNLLPELHNS